MRPLCLLVASLLLIARAVAASEADVKSASDDAIHEVMALALAAELTPSDRVRVAAAAADHDLRLVLAATLVMHAHRETLPGFEAQLAGRFAHGSLAERLAICAAWSEGDVPVGVIAALGDDIRSLEHDRAGDACTLIVQRPYLGGGNLIDVLTHAATGAGDPVVRASALMASAKVGADLRLAVDRSQLADVVERCWTSHDAHVHLTAALAAGVLVPVLQDAQKERLVALISNGLNDPSPWVRASCVIDWYGLGRSVSDLPDLIGGLLLAGDAHLAEEFLTTADQLDPDRSVRTAAIAAVRSRLSADLIAVVDRWQRSP